MTFWPAQAVTPVASSDSLTTNSDRDEDDGRVAEPRERLGEREHAREEQRERDADRDDAEREPVDHERDDRERQDDERCDDGIHALSVVARGPRTRRGFHTETDDLAHTPAHDIRGDG